jgi:hypothetical protein
MAPLKIHMYLNTIMLLALYNVKWTQRRSRLNFSNVTKIQNFISLHVEANVNGGLERIIP